MVDRIAQARTDVESRFRIALALADSEEQRPFFGVEQALWTAVLSLGRALVTLFLARQVHRPRSLEYRHDDHNYRLSDERTSELGTRFGKVDFARRVGRRCDCLRAAADLPIDRELGLCSGFSLGVLVAITRLCAQMAFASARATFKSTYEWTPSPRATLRLVDAAGDQARPFLEQAPPPDDDGDILVVQVDGKGAPMISGAEHQRRQKPHRFPHVPGRTARRLRRRARPRKRRTKGKKSKNAKVAVVGVLYTLKITPQGMEGPIGKRLYATFESHEALFQWLRREADKRGYGRKPTMFLADGLDAIWRLQEQYFAEAEVCLDWYHVVEKLWSAGECLHDEGSAELADWMAKQTARLRRGAISALLRLLKEELDRIPKTGPGNKGRRERLDEILKHLRKNQHRLNYATFRRHDLDIGTGAAEGAVRNLVGMRFDGPGMRWSRQRSERLLHLRCILLNGQWDDFVAHLARGTPFKLAAQPTPTETHDAKAAA
jgi:hypothetical protein